MNPPHKHERDDDTWDRQGEVQIETPRGYKGRIIGTGTIAIFLMTVCTAVTSVDVVQNFRHISAENDVNQRLITSLSLSVAAQNLNTCVMSRPQAERPEQFENPNSLCNRVVANSRATWGRFLELQNEKPR